MPYRVNRFLGRHVCLQGIPRLKVGQWNYVLMGYVTKDSDIPQGDFVSGRDHFGVHIVTQLILGEAQ